MKKGKYLGMIILICCFLNVVSIKAEESISLKVKAATMDSVKLSWNEVTDAKTYEIFRSVKKDSGYKKIATTTANTYKITKLSTSKTYYFKVKAGGLESNTVRKVKVKGFDKTGSLYGKALSSKQRIQVGNKIANFVNTEISAGMSDFDKVKAAHDYIVKKCSRADSWRKNGANTAWGALIYGEAQCSGYARSFKALCDAMGVGCYYVHANSKASNPSHQWNIVKVDGSWYHVDTNCNDNSGFYAVFLLSDKDEKKITGMEWDRSKYPKCKKTYDISKMVEEETEKLSAKNQAYEKQYFEKMVILAEKLGVEWKEEKDSEYIDSAYFEPDRITMTVANETYYINLLKQFEKILLEYKKMYPERKLYAYVKTFNSNKYRYYYYVIEFANEETIDVEEPEPTKAPKSDFSSISIKRYATQDTYSYMEPSTEGTKGSVLSKNQEVNVIAEDLFHGWYQIEVTQNGVITIQYVQMDYFSENQTIVEPPSENSENNYTDIIDGIMENATINDNSNSTD